MSTYEPELGQMIFGNAYAEHDLGDCEGLVANELYALSEVLGKRQPDQQSHGLLGGEWGYGQDFKNDAFEMHPYFWGDCECGFEQAAHEWEEANPHELECWQTRYWSLGNSLDDAGTEYDQRNSILDQWAKDNGWDGRPGVAVFCDCGQDDRWRNWAEAHSHSPTCRVVLPNFRCGDVEVRWYKYIGRGMSVNREVSREEWREVFARCFASIA